MEPIQPLSPSCFYNRFLVPPGSKIKLFDLDPAETCGYQTKEETLPLLQKNKERTFELLNILHAEGMRSFLAVLQSIDAGGKDGTIKHVLGGVNPKFCQVSSFVAPTQEELKHDFLWRIHSQIPPKGSIGVFHRSQYEDVIVPKVKNWVSQDVIEARYKQINDFERMLSENGIKIIKFFFHISHKEQLRRLLKRLEDPEKNYKFNISDLKERNKWDKYQEANEDAINNCSTEWAPFFVIPGDNKWFRNLAFSRICVDTLESMNLKFPEGIIDMDE